MWFFVFVALGFIIALPFAKCHGCTDERSFAAKVLDRFR